MSVRVFNRSLAFGLFVSICKVVVNLIALIYFETPGSPERKQINFSCIHVLVSNGSLITAAVPKTQMMLLKRSREPTPWEPGYGRPSADTDGPGMPMGAASTPIPLPLGAPVRHEVRRCGRGLAVPRFSRPTVWGRATPSTPSPSAWPCSPVLELLAAPNLWV